MTDTVERLIRRVQKTQHGFTDIKRAADEVVAGSATQDSLLIAKKLFASGVFYRYGMGLPTKGIVG